MFSLFFFRFARPLLRFCLLVSFLPSFSPSSLNSRSALLHVEINRPRATFKKKREQNEMDPAPLVLGADPPSRLENELVAAAVPALGAAARTRANAVYYGFCALSVGFVITMAALV